MKNDTLNVEYSTHDLYYAAYLQTAGVRLIRTDKQGSGRLSFIFDSTMSNIEELKTAWFNQSGRVSALQYANSIKNLKHICHMG
jgi:hypothetical protein